MLVGFCALARAHLAYAGFGVTPPYVASDHLLRGSVFQQKVVVVRSDPGDELEVAVSLDMADAWQWVSVDRGMKFTLPQGERQVPIVVRIAVPPDAPYKNFKGAIRISASPSGKQGMIGVGLGARIDVDITVTDKKFSDFRVHEVNIAPFDEGRSFLGLFSAGKIKFAMNIENTGNIATSPSKVLFSISEVGGNKILESAQNTNAIAIAPPFSSLNVTAEIPTHLKSGNYQAAYEVYKGDSVAAKNTIVFFISPYGTIKDGGYGILGLLRPGAIILVLLFFAAIYSGVYVRKRIKSVKNSDTAATPVPEPLNNYEIPARRRRKIV